MIWLQLLYVYLKIGILGFGGGYAMLSLIQADVVDRYGWISLQEFTDIVAISQMTPGPIGINSATYIGYTAVHNAGYSETMSILGSCLTTFAVCLPSFILVLLISYFFAKFRNNKYVEAAFLGLRPATVGLIAAAALLLMNKENFIDYKSFLIFGAAFILTWKFKIHPILMIILAGIAMAVGVLHNRQIQKKQHSRKNYRRKDSIISCHTAQHKIREFRHPRNTRCHRISGADKPAVLKDASHIYHRI